MTRKDVTRYIDYVLDEASSCEYKLSDLRDDAVLVGWQCGFEPMVVAVQSCLPGSIVDLDDACDIAQDWLEDRGWFCAEPRGPDFVIDAERKGE